MNKKLEEEYKKYKNGEKDKRLRELEDKQNVQRSQQGFDVRYITKEEYAEMEKIKKIKANVSKIDNIMELIDRLKAEQKELKEQQRKIEETTSAKQDYTEARKQINRLEEEMDLLTQQRENTVSRLKNKELPQTKREELEKRLKDLDKRIDKNNSDYSVYIDYIEQEKKDSKNEKMPQIAPNEINERLDELSSKISKCNMVCSNLMKGYSWDSIEVKLEKWQDRNFKAKEKIINKSKEGEIDLSTNIIENNRQPRYKEENRELRGQEAVIEDLNKDSALVNTSNFANKHPKLAKIVNWIKDKFAKLINRRKIEPEQTEPEQTEPEQTEPEQTEPEQLEPEQSAEKTTRDKFTEYLKIVAENGLDKVDKDNKEAAKERLAKAKQEAKKRQNEKLGKNYSEKSGDER